MSRNAVQNVRPDQLKKCYCCDTSDYSKLLSDYYGCRIDVEIDEEGYICVDLEWCDCQKALKKMLGVHVTSVHTSDNEFEPYVYMVYNPNETIYAPFRASISKYIFLTGEELSYILSQYRLVVSDVSWYNGLTVTDEVGEWVDREDILRILSEYFQTKIVWYHLDNYEVTGVWLAYEN